MKKQDILTPIGILLGIGFIIYAISQGSVGINAFYDLISIIITIGGSFAALLVTFPLDDIRLLIAMTSKLFTNPSMSKIKTIEMFKNLSIKSRKDGLLSLENQVDEIKDEFLKCGLELVIDGVDDKLIEEVMNNKILEIEGRYNKGSKIFKTWGSYAPAFGMLGTLIGLIQMLAKIDNPDVIASGMAKALITTFYGALLANLILNPLGFNLQNKGDKEAENREMMLVGILCIKNSETTRVLEEKLMSFLTEKEKKKYMNEKNRNKKVEINAA